VLCIGPELETVTFRGMGRVAGDRFFPAKEWTSLAQWQGIVWEHGAAVAQSRLQSIETAQHVALTADKRYRPSAEAQTMRANGSHLWDPKNQTHHPQLYIDRD